ncbi:FAD-dependent monooxygenase [Fictibacillus fluitans]|uniref:FAD-dependent monooxygenase n=1 Tax=Fictibacillus fluitans TaxID=3058422 RepID=A0ABT8HTA2_9BACL|nr:FAD-dependent monooxygenase [Fictibacillus sp. NE201]MDN4523989.1 FAD-dependent monooxygenase [Fictibacillus sp. NE201]
MKALIVGAGIGGLCTAIALEKAGIQTVVYERAAEIKALGAGLGIGANALKGMEKLGIAEEVIQAGHQLDGMVICDQGGKQISKVDTRVISAQYGTDNVTIHRADLHNILMRNLKDTHVVTGKKAVNAEQNEQEATVYFEDGTSEKCDYIIAADGIHSIIRQKLMPESVPRYAGYTCWRGIIDHHPFNENTATETWGRNGRFGIVPLANQKLYWFACVNANAHDPKMKAMKTEDLHSIFRDYHDPIPFVIQMTEDHALIHNDILDITPIKRFAFDRILLLGDAAHASTPNMGQGAGQAIEDAIILGNCLKEHEDAKSAFKAFEAKRMERTAKIIKMSRRIGQVGQLENKMMIKVRNFLLKRESEAAQLKRMAFLYDVDLS